MKTIQENAVQEPVLAAMLAWWRNKCTKGSMPPVSALDPTQIPGVVLPHIAVLEPPDKDDRIRIRLTGTELDREFGENVSGMYLDEFTSGDLLGYLTSLSKAAVSQRSPVYSYGKMRLPNRHLMVAYRLYLPFGDDVVRRLVACHGFRWAEAEDAGVYSTVSDGRFVLDHREFKVASNP